MKRGKIVILAIASATIVIVAAIVLASGIMSHNESEPFGNDEWRSHFTPWTGSYHVGDFLSYSYHKSFFGGQMENGTFQKVILELSDDVMITNTDSDYEWKTDTVAFSMGFLALIHGFDTDPGFYNSARITFLGVDMINTKWGVLQCDHFRLENKGNSAYEEEWCYKGIAVRSILSTPNVTTSSEIIFQQYDLIDSNFPELTG